MCLHHISLLWSCCEDCYRKCSCLSILKWKGKYDYQSWKYFLCFIILIFTAVPVLQSYCSLTLNWILLIGSMDELLCITLTYFPTQLFILESSFWQVLEGPCPGASTEMPRSFSLLLHLNLTLMSNWDDTPALLLNYWYVFAVHGEVFMLAWCIAKWIMQQ